MIDLHWPTPEGHPVSILLEKCGCYWIVPVTSGAVTRFQPELKGAPGAAGGNLPLQGGQGRRGLECAERCQILLNQRVLLPA